MLNQPREIDWDFRALLWEGWVWLYDESSRTYVCSMTPSIYVYPLYPVKVEDDGYPPEPTYIDARSLSEFDTEPVIALSHCAWEDEGITNEQAENEAWATAMEEAYANHPIPMEREPDPEPQTELLLHPPIEEKETIMPQYLTTTELANLLRVKHTTVAKMARQGKNPQHTHWATLEI